MIQVISVKQFMNEWETFEPGPDWDEEIRMDEGCGIRMVITHNFTRDRTFPVRQKTFPKSYFTTSPR